MSSLHKEISFEAVPLDRIRKQIGVHSLLAADTEAA